jgi:hypothetical protein
VTGATAKPTEIRFGEPSCDQAIGDVFKGMMNGVKKQHPGGGRLSSSLAEGWPV